MLGIKVAASAIWQILKDAGVDPTPDRADTTWGAFLRSQADAILACDFMETVTGRAAVSRAGTDHRTSSDHHLDIRGQDRLGGILREYEHVA